MSAVTLSSRPASAARAEEHAARAVQLDADHQALAADLDDAVDAARARARARAQVLADGLRRSPAGLPASMMLQRLDAGAHRQRVAAEGGAVVARAEHVRRALAHHQGADRHARAQALGQAASRRAGCRPTGSANHLPVRAMPHCTSSSISSQPCSSQMRAQLAQVVVARRVDAAFALHRPPASRRRRSGASRATSRTAAASLNGTRTKPSTSGPKPAWILGLPVADSVASERPWKARFADDDLGALDALVVAVLARDLDAPPRWPPGRSSRRTRRPGPSARTASRPGSPAAAPGSSWSVWISLPTWSAMRRHQLRVRMAQRVDGDAAQRVEVLRGPRCPRPSCLGRATTRTAGGRRCSSHGAWRRVGHRGSLLSGRWKQKAGGRGRYARPTDAGQGRNILKAADCDTGDARVTPLDCCDATAQGTIRGSPSPRPRCTPTEPRQFFIQGQTLDGRAFRPSDWAERLAGAMSCFRPGGAQGGIGSFIGYSPYCVPRLIDGVKNVIVDERAEARSSRWPGTSS